MVKNQFSFQSLSDEQFEKLFPFYFILDSSMQLIRCGRSMCKLFPYKNGCNFEDFFTLLRPQSEVSTFEDLVSCQDILIILQIEGKLNRIKLRGQFQYIKDSDCLLFIGTPWFNDISQLPAAGLTMQDFALYDTQLDLLQALNSQESVTSDIRTLLTKLSAQKKELERNSEQLKANQSQLQLLSIIAEQTVNGVIITDNKGKIEWVNESFTKITGFTLDEVINKTPGSFLQGPESDPETIKYIGERTRKGLDFSAEIINYNKNGCKYWIKISGHPIKNEKGEVVKFFALEENITARMKTEQALREAKEKADATSHAKDIFLANMSHEMRTPLNAILGMGNQLKKTVLDNEQFFFLETMNSAAEHLLVVINDILDLSRIEAGKLQLENVDFDLISLTTRCMQVLSPKAEEKGLDFKMIIDDRISKVLIGDPYRLNQILLNLLNNSIKFTEKGSVSIEIMMVKDNNDSQMLRFMVDDTGIGMDDKFLANIFKKFTQEDSSIARKYGGTGLGLNITKQLVELMGGNINVKSIKNVGSLFLIDLVFKKGNKENLQTENKIEISPSILKNVEVLLVEDNEMNRILAKTILKNYNANTTEAENGLKSIAALKEKKFDIILMDIQMPLMGGFEATQHIRHELQMDIPIIALTANALKGELEKCLDAGMNAYLSKPFKEEDLIRLIAGLLNLNVAENKEMITTENSNSKTQMLKNEFKNDSEAILYDLEYLKEVFGDSAEVINAMLDAFVKEAELGVVQLDDYCQQNDAAGLRSTAHRLKSNLAMLNAHELRDIALKIETDAKDGVISEDLILTSKKFNEGLSTLLTKVKYDLEASIV